MKAPEVLRRYAQGQRNFQNLTLRGQSFKGQDLSEADFSGADIRGANFSNAVLKGAKFVGAKGGVQRRWLLSKQLIALMMFILSGVLAAFVGVAIAILFFDTITNRQTYFLAGWIVLGLLVVVLSVLVRQGFTSRAFLTIAATIAVVVAVIFAGAFSITIAGVGAVIFAGAFSVTIASTVAIALAGALAGVGAVTGASTGAAVMAVAGITAGIAAGAVSFVEVFAGASAHEFAVMRAGVGVVSAAVMLFSLYVVWRTAKGDEKFAVVRNIGIALSSLGGTAFCGADLTRADFSQALLRRTNFSDTRQRQTILKHTCWHEAKGLGQASLGNSILSNAAVRDLLVTRYGYKKSYRNANLRDANLDGANLNQANLQGADLSEATLHYAELHEADLTEALALGTDFTGAYLTGACLEAWTIDQNTNLEGVDCQYVYLLRNQRGRRPGREDFVSGEFTKLFQKVPNTVDLIFCDGVDWEAFLIAFQQVQLNNKDVSLEVHSLENKGSGVVVVRVKALPGANQETIHSDFNREYQTALKILEALYQKEWQVRESDIAYYRQVNADMLVTIKALAEKQQAYLRFIAKTNAMNESTR